MTLAISIIVGAMLLTTLVGLWSFVHHAAKAERDVY